MKITHRFFIELAYKGTAYHGWQIQENASTVQQEINKALSVFFRQDIATVGCGRTDTGVHATQLYAHFDLVTDSDFLKNLVTNDDAQKKTLAGINALLPYDIAIKHLIAVTPDAHARFDAISRSYQYYIHFKKDPFRQDFSWLMQDIPEINLMNKAAQILMEYQDFSCFSKSNTQTFTNNCKIKKAKWEHNSNGLVFNISADRFLRNMVRAIVGTLVWVGKREIEPEAIRQIIESKNRSNAGASVPACGLYLTEVKYPYIK